MASLSGILSDLNSVLFRAEEIDARVREMAREIQAVYEGKAITVVALMDGALFFVADLLRHLDLPIRLVTLSASSYHGGMESNGEVRFNWPANVKFAGLDDILDTGLTLVALQKRLMDEGPATLRMGVLLTKKKARAFEIVADFSGFEIDDDFVVGYGMDYQGRFRNLPCIGILKP